MRAAVLIGCCAQLVWFFGCIVTYRVGRRVLVDGMGVKSAEFGMFCVFAAALALFVFVPSVGKWALRVVLAFWLVIQFFCHWYYTIFGATEKKLRGYNSCFRDTIRVIPASDTRVIPDLYHMVLHLMLCTNLTLILLY